MDASAWVERFGSEVVPPGPVLDVACGGGRHARWFASRGYDVVAVDRDLSGVHDLALAANVELVERDLEDGAPFPFAPRAFGAVVVTNYLWRPILDAIVEAVADGGWLLYETFAVGNERFGRPTNPDFLLRRDELLELANRHHLDVLASEDQEVAEPRPAVVQRIAARRPRRGSETGNPPTLVGQVSVDGGPAER
jgi:SAM-dependent methyltransferase